MMSKFTIWPEYTEGVLITVEADSREDALELFEEEWGGEIDTHHPRFVGLENDGGGERRGELIDVSEVTDNG